MKTTKITMSSDRRYEETKRIIEANSKKPKKFAKVWDTPKTYINKTGRDADAKTTDKVDTKAKAKKQYYTVIPPLSCLDNPEFWVRHCEEEAAKKFNGMEYLRWSDLCNRTFDTYVKGFTDYGFKGCEENNPTTKEFRYAKLRNKLMFLKGKKVNWYNKTHLFNTGCTAELLTGSGKFGITKYISGVVIMDNLKPKYEYTPDGDEKLQNPKLNTINYALVSNFRKYAPHAKVFFHNAHTGITVDITGEDGRALRESLILTFKTIDQTTNDYIRDSLDNTFLHFAKEHGYISVKESVTTRPYRKVLEGSEIIERVFCRSCVVLHGRPALNKVDMSEFKCQFKSANCGYVEEHTTSAEYINIHTYEDWDYQEVLDLQSKDWRKELDVMMKHPAQTKKVRKEILDIIASEYSEFINSSKKLAKRSAELTKNIKKITDLIQRIIARGHQPGTLDMYLRATDLQAKMNNELCTINSEYSSLTFDGTMDNTDESDLKQLD